MEKDTSREELKSDLITQKYTYIQYEKEFKYSAPHKFTVRNKLNNDVLTIVKFQEGPIKVSGVNGCTNEDLIAMIIRRLEGFQESEYSSTENAITITKLEEALMQLRIRTLKREKSGKEGTNIV